MEGREENVEPTTFDKLKSLLYLKPSNLLRCIGGSPVSDLLLLLDSLVRGGAWAMDGCGIKLFVLRVTF